MAKRKHISFGKKCYYKAEKAVMQGKRAAIGAQVRSSLEVEADARRLMDAIPRDTRSLTGRVFGDPLLERSALYQRGQA